MCWYAVHNCNSLKCVINVVVKMGCQRNLIEGFGEERENTRTTQTFMQHKHLIFVNLTI